MAPAIATVLPSQHKGKPLAHWKTLSEKHISQEPSLELGLPKNRDPRLSVWKASEDHEKSQDFWKANLKPSEFEALRCHDSSDHSDSETSGSEKYAKFFPKHGHFACRACGLALFSAESKVRSNNCGNKQDQGLPHFGCSVENHVHLVETKQHQLQKQNSHTKLKHDERIETQCARCRSHLGQVHVDRMPTRQHRNVFFRERHVVNGLSIAYVKEDLETSEVYDRAVVLHHPSVIMHNFQPVKLFK